jgi:hypothetical protein
MDMATAHFHVAEGAYVMRDGQHQQPHSQKSDEEAERRETADDADDQVSADG